MALTAQQKKKDKALAAYIDCGTITAACEAVGMGRRTWYNWIADDPEFAEAAEHARDTVADDLEKEAIRRAKDGSDVLMIFLLKSLRPDKYKERRESVNVNVEATPEDRMWAGAYKMGISEYLDRKAKNTLPPPPGLPGAESVH